MNGGEHNLTLDKQTRTGHSTKGGYSSRFYKDMIDLLILEARAKGC